MGYIYITLSAFFFCLMTIFVKIAGQQLATVQIVLIRGIITLCFTYAIIRRKKVCPICAQIPISNKAIQLLKLGDIHAEYENGKLNGIVNKGK